MCKSFRERQEFIASNLDLWNAFLLCESWSPTRISTLHNPTPILQPSAQRGLAHSNWQGSYSIKRASGESRRGSGSKEVCKVTINKLPHKTIKVRFSLSTLWGSKLAS